MRRRPDSFSNSQVRLASLACCVHLALGTAVAQEVDDRVTETLEKARPALLAHLRTAQRGPLALLTLAAVHDGVPQDDPIFARAIERLQKQRLTGTYELALRLMVLQDAPWFPDRMARARSDLRALLRNWKNGGFTYPESRGDRNWDLSNTQYGALGLRAARSLDLAIPAVVWRQLADTISGAQADDGGFGYGPTTRRLTYASMTVAGIGVLEICREAMGDGEASRALAPRIRRGWRWLDDHVLEIGDVRTRQSFYFHYGLERAGILSDVDEVGGRNWYEWGAEMFVREQLEAGGWRTRGHGSDLGFAQPDAGLGTPVDTAFAVLFLRRKFPRSVVPITARRAVTLASLAENAGEDDIVAAARLAVAQGSAGMRSVLDAMRSDVVPRRKAAARALAHLCEEPIRYNPYRDAAHNRDAIARAEAWLAANPHR